MLKSVANSVCHTQFQSFPLYNKWLRISTYLLISFIASEHAVAGCTLWTAHYIYLMAWGNHWFSEQYFATIFTSYLKQILFRNLCQIWAAFLLLKYRRLALFFWDFNVRLNVTLMMWLWDDCEVMWIVGLYLDILALHNSLIVLVFEKDAF